MPRAVTRWVVLGLLLLTLLSLLAVQGLSDTHHWAQRDARARQRAALWQAKDRSSPGARAASSPGTSRPGGASRSPSMTAQTRAGRRGSPPSCAACMCRPPSSSSAARSSGIRTSCGSCTGRASSSATTRSRTPTSRRFPGWEQRLQIGLTDNALAGTVGIRPRLFRPPYSSVPAACHAGQARAYERLARGGYDIVLTDLTARTGAARESTRSSPPPRLRAGAAASSSSTTAAATARRPSRALERLVPALRARGFRFVTVSQLAGLARSEAEVPVDRWGRAAGRVLIATLARRALDDDDPRVAADRGRAPLRRPRLPAARLSPGVMHRPCAAGDSRTGSHRRSRSSSPRSTRSSASSAQFARSRRATTPSSR